MDPFTGQQVGQPGPLPYADITDPQTLNKYAYVRNNPLRYVDPDGHCGTNVQCWNWVGTQGQRALTVGANAVTSALVLGSTALGSLASTIPGTQLGTPDLFGGGNPNVFLSENKPGTLEKPDHQETVKEEGRRVNGQTEVKIATPGGKKDSRRADAVGTNPSNRPTRNRASLSTAPAGNIPKRERDAAADIQGATGVKPTMVPVRPLPPPKPPSPTGGAGCQ